MDEILDLIESVSEGFPTYSLVFFFFLYTAVSLNDLWHCVKFRHNLNNVFGAVLRTRELRMGVEINSIYPSAFGRVGDREGV